MMLTEEWLKETKDKYLQVRRLLDEESKKDPVTEPYKSKYQARKLLQSIESDLNVCRSETEPSPSKSSLISSLVDYELGVISYETEELSDTEDLLKKCLSSLKGHEVTPECCVLTVNALNQMGILWSGRNELQKACKFLKEAESIYIQYFEKESFVPPLDPLDYFEQNPCIAKGKNAFEKAHTHTLYYLAQVYKNMDDDETSAAYCQTTLKRQLESKEYDPIDWSLNCAVLSQYFFANDNLTVGRHFLASAQYILSCYETELVEKQEKSEKMMDKVKKCKASIARCWTEYGLLILHLSQQDLLFKASLDSDSDAKDNEKKDKTKDVKKDSYILVDKPEIKDIEKKITDKLVVDFDQARCVFLYVQNWIKIAKEYFVLDGYATDHVQVIQDYSRLYKLLAFFESDPDRQCKMHKRRVDVMEEVLNQLNLRYYLMICRQLMFELAETYSEIMDIKYDIMERNKNNVTPHAMKKINVLAFKSIQYFQKFIDTLKIPENDYKLPETYSDDVVRPALVAHFCIGRILSKICAETREKLENLKKTEKYYKYIINYIDKNPSHLEAVKNELPLIKEMVQLMPGKMQSVISNIMY